MRGNNEKSNYLLPSFPFVAHHIVPPHQPEAQLARDVLDAYGFKLNGADNGVFLPTERNPNAPYDSLRTDTFKPCPDSYCYEVSIHMNDIITTIQDWDDYNTSEGYKVVHTYIFNGLTALGLSMIDGKLKVEEELEQ